MTTLIGISGSLRKGSFNSALLRAAAGMMPADCELRIESIADVPLYDGDVESAGIPAAVARLKDAVAAADGLVLATPEYNNSVPGVAKNVIDWMSRPPADSARVFRGKPVALLGASPGSFGTVLSQSAWLPVFRILGCDCWAGPRFALARADNAIGATGDITDATTRELLRKFVAGFAAYVRRNAS
ncbi:MAG TPA: NADPH-dependent FMN reductase [Rhodocyclaceae bacterium]